MDILNQTLNQPIKEVITQHPKVGEILDEHDIGCVTCSVGTCLLKDIVEIHNLSPEEEQKVLEQILTVIHPDKEFRIPKRKRKAAGEKKIAYSPPMKKLVDEHALIKRWVALIPDVVARMNIDSDEGRKLVRNGIDFIRSYADRYHHAKEEDILFKYFDEDLDILAVMHEDHETARNHVKEITVALERKDKKTVAEHLNAYSELLTEHIKKEDEILYPWMDRNLSDRQVGDLYSKFREKDGEFGDTPAKYEVFIEELEKRRGG